MLAILDYKNAFLGRCVVGIYSHGDILVGMMVVRGKAEGRLSLGHGEFFGCQTDHWRSHRERGGSPKSYSMQLRHLCKVHYRMRRKLSSGALIFGGNQKTSTPVACESELQ